MNPFEAKQQARRERYLERSQEAAKGSDVACQASRDAVSAIPMGQPILVDHYSAGRHRGALKRSDSQMRKACDLSDKAEYYARKAEGVGSGGISSDDPDALQKLRAQLSAIQTSQERMKAANKAIRANKTAEKQILALVALGFSEEQAKEIITPDFCRRVGFPTYALSNNNANGKRIEKRIKQLEALSKRQTVEVEADGYIYREDTDENRCMFKFEDKPSKAARKILTSHAFRWSPTRDAWVRQLTNAGIWASKQVKAELATVEIY